jgi:hypothetical protein
MRLMRLILLLLLLLWLLQGLPEMYTWWLLSEQTSARADTTSPPLSSNDGEVRQQLFSADGSSSDVSRQ